ncbi:MAG: hypothetical protein RLZZ460_859 [Chloroflexota bacterium]
MPALEECAVGHGTQGPSGDQARPPLRIVMLHQGENSGTTGRRLPDRRSGVVGTGGGVDRHKVRRSGRLRGKGR